jgi:hypothetical protein
MYYPEDGWIEGQVYAVTGCLHYTFEEYKIEVRNAGDIIQGAVNGVSASNMQVELGVFPNPTQNEIRLNSDAPGQLRIIDAAGRTVLTESIQVSYPTIDVSNLTNGTYTVEFMSDRNRMIARLLKH